MVLEFEDSTIRSVTSEFVCIVDYNKENSKELDNALVKSYYASIEHADIKKDLHLVADNHQFLAKIYL